MKIAIDYGHRDIYRVQVLLLTTFSFVSYFEHAVFFINRLRHTIFLTDYTQQ